MKQSPFTLMILLIIFIIIIGGVRDDNTNKISKGSIVISPDNHVSFFQGKLKGSNTVEKQSEKNFELVCPNLYKFKDACNVYLLKSGSAGILIETGSGKVLDYLEEVGVEKIEWVLHTHSHRDQCFGDLLLKKHGSKIAIGKQEADALQPAGINPPFAPPGNSGKYSKLPSLPGRMEPFQKPGVDRELTNGEEIEWKQYKLQVINTPGHTKGSVSFLVEVDGKKICFCGDLMVSGGRVRDLYSMQWIYLQNPGIDSSLVSLQKIRESDPGL
ncbi:MBL fold metallo-hydrolase, partial [bacterium]|nr:MBL fold metallo-hydrolase [bacterium]